MSRLKKGQGGDAGRSQVVKVRMQPELWEAVKAQASELGVFPSGLVRDLVDLGVRWSLDRVKRKLSVLHGILEQEERLDSLLDGRGGDLPLQTGDPGRLDVQSVAALLRGAVADPAPTFALLRALLEAHDQIGAERVKEEVGRALAELPAGDRAAAKRRIGAAAAALKSWQKLYKATAEAPS